MARCRWCRAEIVWASTAARAMPMPLDARANPEGNVRLDNVAGALTATVLGPLDRLLEQDRPLYMPHHATCPAVERQRGGAPADELAARRAKRQGTGS